MEDIAAGFLCAASSNEAAGEIINLRTRRKFFIQDIVRKIFSLTRQDLEVVSDPVRVRPEKSEVGRLVCDNRKAVKLLGWEPRVSLTEGLERTMAHLEKNLTRYKSEIYNI